MNFNNFSPSRKSHFTRKHFPIARNEGFICIESEKRKEKGYLVNRKFCPGSIDLGED
jgi:hypothetical protein